MDNVYFPEDLKVSRNSWTEGDRNMSQFFIYAYANFSWYGNPTPKNILGIHWDMTVKEEIQRYLALNTTENSTTLWNYRQKECSFWMEYLPSVIGYITPTYPPTTEFWWEPESPIQIAFWSMSSTSLLLLAIVIISCLLWQNAKRQSKIRYADAAAAGSMVSLKHHPGDFDHFDDKGRISPALSNRSGFTEKSRLENHDGVSLKSFQGGVLQPSPSTHSLRSLGLTRVQVPPMNGGQMINGGPPSMGGPQPHSRQPSFGMGRQPSLHGLPAQGPVMGMPPGQGGAFTPAVTPTPQHRPMPVPVGQPYTINGVSVGPGEIPNNAGPFINGGHDLSNDSIMSQQSGGHQFDPRGSGRAQPPVQMDSGLPSKYPPPSAMPMSQPKTPTKLVPGRMSQNSDKWRQPGAETGSRPQSRAGGRANRGAGVIPSTAV